MKKVILLLLLSLSSTVFAADPTWFNREEFSNNNLDLYRYYRSMVRIFDCWNPHLPYQEICRRTSDAHDEVVNIGMCLENGCQFNQLQNITRFYLRLRYPEFREEYAKKPRSAEAEQVLIWITRTSLVHQEYMTPPPN